MSFKLPHCKLIFAFLIRHAQAMQVVDDHVFFRALSVQAAGAEDNARYGDASWRVAR